MSPFGGASPSRRSNPSSERGLHRSRRRDPDSQRGRGGMWSRAKAALTRGSAVAIAQPHPVRECATEPFLESLLGMRELPQGFASVRLLQAAHQPTRDMSS